MRRSSCGIAARCPSRRPPPPAAPGRASRRSSTAARGRRAWWFRRARCRRIRPRRRAGWRAAHGPWRPAPAWPHRCAARPCRRRRSAAPAQLLQALGQDGGVARHALRDALQALRPVVHRVHARHHGRQHLRGADVGGGLLAPDVLLARLQREPVGGVAVRVDADAHQAARHGALEFVAAGQVGVRAAGAHGHAEALGGAHHDVGAEFAGRHQQRQRQQVGGDDERRLLRVGLLHVGAQVVDRPLVDGYCASTAK